VQAATATQGRGEAWRSGAGRAGGRPDNGGRQGRSGRSLRRETPHCGGRWAKRRAQAAAERRGVGTLTQADLDAAITCVRVLPKVDEALRRRFLADVAEQLEVVARERGGASTSTRATMGAACWEAWQPGDPHKPATSRPSKAVDIVSGFRARQRDRKARCTVDVRTDGVQAWPEDIAYYVIGYHVRLSDAFVDRVRLNQWTVPKDVRVQDSSLEVRRVLGVRTRIVAPLRVDGTPEGGEVADGPRPSIRATPRVATPALTE
jgi:hypothetical protein